MLCHFLGGGGHFYICMFCIILCSHRVWNPNPSLNLNLSPAVEISHKCEQSITFVFYPVHCSNVRVFENRNNQISKHVDGRLKKRTEDSMVNQRIQPLQQLLHQGTLHWWIAYCVRFGHMCVND